MHSPSLPERARKREKEGGREGERETCVTSFMDETNKHFNLVATSRWFESFIRSIDNNDAKILSSNFYSKFVYLINNYMFC